MSPALPPRWTRPAQFLVYLVPVGDIPPDLFASYAQLLQAHSVLPLRSLTRPGGYAAELSPFRSLDWAGPGSLRFRFVSTAEHVEAYDGEDVHASRRVIGALGVCHSPSLTLSGGLRTAHAQFEASVQRFSGLLIHKLFAFEHTFEDATASECEGLGDLVMFPVHHELQGTGESTVSLHLQVVMDTLAVNILMSLESVIRSATSSAASSGLALAAGGGDLASVLLDVNVEPQRTNPVHDSVSSPLVLSRDTNADAIFSSASSPTSRSLGPSLPSIPSPLAAGVAALDPRNRRRKRQLARREKLLGDYNVLVSCISDAMDHYTVAVEMLREEERRSGGVQGDALWLAAALEGYVFCLYTELQGKFSTELVEKASEAVAFYAKAGTIELESLLLENLGSYYASVAMTAAPSSNKARLLQSVWTKRLLWEVLERGMTLLPELQPQRQIEFLIRTSRILESVGHRRRVALFLHEAASLLLARNAPSVDAQARLVLSPTTVTKAPQKLRDLEAALVLERAAAERLGIQGQGSAEKSEFSPWKVTTQHRKTRRTKSAAKNASMKTPDDSWLIVRFHVLRQLVTIARMLGDALLVGTYCLQLLEMLTWCDSIAIPPEIDPLHSCSSPALRKAPASHDTLLVDHLQRPATSLRTANIPVERIAAGLHAKSGIYFFPPPGIDTRVKRNFINSPSATMSNAAASLSSTLTNTPRILATPRQQFSAAVNAISTKASPAFSSFSNVYYQHNGALLSRSGSTEDRALAATVADQKELSNACVDGEGGHKVARSLDAGDSDVDGTLRFDTMTGSSSPWDLRSKTAIAKIERKLFNMLESECTALRSTEQMRLPTFLRVDKLKLRSSCSLQSPFLSRATALEMFGVQSASSNQAVKSDFFYSPFEKQKVRKTGQNETSDEGDDMPAMYERSFPTHERIELQLTLSNPTGVTVKLQEVKAWVTFSKEDDNRVDEENGSASPTILDGGVECYPCSFTLEPYQKCKLVVLGIQPLKVGALHVRGCFIKTFNIKTSFELDNPVKIRVVDELPMVSFSLHEHHSMILQEAAMPNERVAAKTRLAMFSSETRQCLIRIRSTGNRQITNYRLAVTVQHRHAAKKTCVAFNNLPPASEADSMGVSATSCSINDRARAYEPDEGTIDTQLLSLRCGKVMSSPLPLVNGDVVSIPFEISLKGSCGPVDDDIQIEWSFVYADETHYSPNAIDNARRAIFYRESKLTFELAPLPSLKLQSVTLLPCCAEQILTRCSLPEDKASAAIDVGESAPFATTDHLYCLVMVHIVNPTETSFRFRLRRSIDDSGKVTCEAEIGRQCSRRFIVEIPRLPSLSSDQGPSSLTHVLNNLVKMEWETYFGTGGRLLCEDCHVGPTTDYGRMKLELVVPPVCFRIQSLDKEVGDEEQHGSMDAAKSSISLHPSSFFQAAHLRVTLQSLQIRLFTYVPITIAAQRADNEDEQVLSVELQVLITGEGEKRVCGEMNDHVMVVGQLKTIVTWDNVMDKRAKLHQIQCMFLSEGTFRVTVCGRVIGSKTQQVGGEVWCHQPVHICARAEDADRGKKTATII